MIFPDTIDKIPIEVLRTVVLSDSLNLTGVDGDPASSVYLPFDVIHDTPLPTKPGDTVTKNSVTGAASCARHYSDDLLPENNKSKAIIVCFVHHVNQWI